MKKRCTNNAAEKSAEVADAMRLYGNLPGDVGSGMAELYRRGCFRHLEDIAMARILLERGRSIDVVAKDLDEPYEGPRGHRCDRVYPPS